MGRYSTKKLFAAVVLIGVGAALIAVLCRSHYYLDTESVMPLLIAVAAGASIGAGFAILMQWPVVELAIAGAILSAIVLMALGWEWVYPKYWF